MSKLLKQKTLIDAVIASFSTQTGLSAHVKMPEFNMESILMWVEGLEEPFEVYVKTAVTSQNLASTIYEMSYEKHTSSKILVTSYINPNLMERLREAKVFCLDAVGNAFIHKPPFYLFIKGNKPIDEVAVKKGRAFHYTGLKVIFALLQKPSILHQTYRQIAKMAGVSLGSIGGILEDLAHSGYIQITSKERILLDRKGLLKRWVEEYPILKQKHFMGSFTCDNPHWWKEVDIRKFQGLWGGEVAAEIYTNYLQAKDAVLFIPREQKATLLKSVRLKKYKAREDENCIDLIEPFWSDDLMVERKEDLAPPLLVYAELLHSNDARNLETAKRIYEQYLD